MGFVVMVALAFVTVHGLAATRRRLQNRRDGIITVLQIRAPESDNHQHSYDVCLRPSPLIGGPEWLPLHVQVLLRRSQRKNSDNPGMSTPTTSIIMCWWDFVPLDATNPQTLARLMTLQAVPGEIRFSRISTSAAENHKDAMVIMIQQQVNDDFCPSYPRDLQLVTNNCWTFAASLLFFLKNNFANDENKHNIVN